MQPTITASELKQVFGWSKRQIERNSAMSNWPAPCGISERGERVWQVADLPETIVLRRLSFAVREVVQSYLFGRVLKAEPRPNLPVVPRGMGGLVRRERQDAELDAVDRQRRDAALVLCAALDEAVGTTGCSRYAAICELAGWVASGAAAPELMSAAAVTYVKPRPGGQQFNAVVSRFKKMDAAYRQGLKEGDGGKYLVPSKPQKRMAVAVHLRAFVLHYCHPNRPSVAEAHRVAAQWYRQQGLEIPAVDTWYRIERELPVTVKYRGRMTGAEYRALLPYIKRDVSMFKANDFWVCDGHSFKAKVAHPIHGQPFAPEVSIVLDWVSRRVVGWSVDLAESTIAVSAALRHAQQRTRARCLIYYSDNGGGQTGKFIDCRVHGSLARQGIAHETGIPGNPQGRGIIERLWQVVTIPLARTYPTCTWRGADKESVRKSLVLLGSKKDDRYRALPSWQQFLMDLEGAINHYNAKHPHRELNGITPDQAYQAKLDPDSVDLTLTDAELNELWLPQIDRVPDRGLVRLFGNEYFRKELKDELSEGERVYVRFDIHDANQVWLYRLDGRYIGTAQWDAHKKAAFPVPFVQRKAEERRDGRVKLAEKKISEANAELGNTLDMETLVPVRFDPVPEREELVSVAVKHEDVHDEDGSYADTMAMLRRWGEKQGDDPEDKAVNQ
jgi:putative transposase